MIRGIPAQQQAATLGVDYAVKGTVQRSQNEVRVTAELVQAGTGTTIWAKHYQRKGADLFEVQDDIVRGIAASLTVELSDRERRTINRIPTRNLEAQDYYRRAEYQVTGLTEAESFRRALAAYRRAFELDPDFADAYAGYARIAATVWRRDFNEIMSSAVARHDAYDAAGKAMQLDPENARAYEVLSIIQAVEGEHQIAVDPPARLSISSRVMPRRIQILPMCSSLPVIWRALPPKSVSQAASTPPFRRT